MKMITLKNPSPSDIIDYKIEEIQFDPNGNPMLDKDEKPMKTGRTLEWTLKAGEELKFPEYVATYLKSIYEFLEVKGEETETPVESSAKPVEGGAICKVCGKTLKGVKGLALHLAINHPDEILNR